MDRSKPPRKKLNLELRSREYLTPQEMETLITTARQIGRHSYRDSTMILIAYRHGLRVSELVSLRWEQVDLRGALLHVCRRKNGVSSTHPLYGVEIRALRKLKSDYSGSPYVFLTERNGPLTDSTFRKIVARVGERANMPFTIHPHMLRHSTGFKLANEGHDLRAIQLYLGHKSIQNTVWYTELSSHRFKDFWKD
jgi:type 1 fimbriae regulatory protein FimB/type 1 fimbriae regulatory protein FimE